MMPGPQRTQLMLLTCPDCATELTQIKKALWCWKCERYLRRGEANAARKAAGQTQPFFGRPR